VSESEKLVPVFIPALVVLLEAAEDMKGTPLTTGEVHAIRDRATCIMMAADVAHKMDDSRGYPDVDPENCWHDWQMTRRASGRKPDLDPGPRFNSVRSSDSAYQQTILDARSSLEQFRAMLPSDGTPRSAALIKTRLVDGDNSAFMWLTRTALDGPDFTAELFEVPENLPSYQAGVRHRVSVDELLDWMVNDEGRLTGGFSLRYHRAGLSDAEKVKFDDYIGVTEYL